MVVRRFLSGIGVVDHAVWLRIFADREQRWVVGDPAERLPQQGVGHDRHRLPLAQALAVERADHIIGEPGSVQVSGHERYGFGVETSDGSFCCCQIHITREGGIFQESPDRKVPTPCN